MVFHTQMIKNVKFEKYFVNNSHDNTKNMINIGEIFFDCLLDRR